MKVLSINILILYYIICYKNATICKGIWQTSWCSDSHSDHLDLLPVAAGVLKKRGIYQSQRLFGVCQIDKMRAEAIGQEPRKFYVVVGGQRKILRFLYYLRRDQTFLLTEEETRILIQFVSEILKKWFKYEIISQ